MASTTDNEFPKYTDGDVSIYVCPTRIYQLHSAVLRRNSTYFEQQLRTPGARLTGKARNEGRAAYRFELVGRANDGLGHFERLVSFSVASDSVKRS
jgi:hypothetical protein